MITISTLSNHVLILANDSSIRALESSRLPEDLCHLNQHRLSRRPLSNTTRSYDEKDSCSRMLATSWQRIHASNLHSRFKFVRGDLVAASEVTWQQNPSFSNLLQSREALVVLPAAGRPAISRKKGFEDAVIQFTETQASYEQSIDLADRVNE